MVSFVHFYFCELPTVWGPVITTWWVGGVGKLGATSGMASLLVGVTTGLRLGLRGGGLARKEGMMDGGEKVKSSLMFAWGWVLLSRDQL